MSIHPGNALYSSALADELDDYSHSFHRMRSRLVNDAGVTYFSFRSTLKPRYWVVWVQIVLAYLAIVVVMTVLARVGAYGLVIGVSAALAASILVGYAIAYIGLFFHGASHYELSANKARNDWLANVFIGILFGYPIRNYRQVHFNHHRLLGLPEDPENGYIERLNVRFFVESVTGLRFLRTILAHLKGKSAILEKKKFPVWAAAGALLHLTIAGVPLLAGQYPITIAWSVGFILVSPTVAAIRIVLEHGSEGARTHVDSSQKPHAAVTRVFGDGLLAGTLGGAGFNRHLLHHWDPQVPYTRLRELENYLRTTQLREVVEVRSTTYAATFRKLFRIR